MDDLVSAASKMYSTAAASGEPLGYKEAARRLTEVTGVDDEAAVCKALYAGRRAASKNLGTEESLKRNVLDSLDAHFNIWEEVWGTHWSGRRIRIDAIVSPKDDSAWKTKSPKLGIEFKNYSKFDVTISIKDYTKWWAQCVDYSETNFDGHGYLHVFPYNGFYHYESSTRRTDELLIAKRIMGRLGVGELRKVHRKGLCFLLQDSRVWSEEQGVEVGKTWSMCREKFGSR